MSMFFCILDRPQFFGMLSLDFSFQLKTFDLIFFCPGSPITFNFSKDSSPFLIRKALLYHRLVFIS